MAKQINVSVGGVVKKVKKVPLGIGGVVKEAKKGVCGVGGVVKTFFESNIITKLTCNDKFYKMNYNSYLYIASNESSDEKVIRAYGYVYGDFAGKPYSFTISSDDGDEENVSVEIYYSGSRQTLVFGSKTTRTGTFPDGTTHFCFKTGNNRDYSGGINVYSVILDGTEYLDYLKTATWTLA